MQNALSRRPFVMLGVAALIFSAALAARLIQAQSPFPASAAGNNSEFAPITARSSIERLQAHLKIYPNDTNAYAQLGANMLQRVRENADPSLYIQAEGAFNEALKRDPQQLEALIGMGSLSLSRHEFAQALIWGQKALAVNPYRAQIYGVIGDAQVELGRYADAVQTIQKMVDTRPDIASYSRVSYLRELHGDVPGAIDAMTRAARAGAPDAEPTLWAQTYIGHLHFNMGDLKRAEKMYAAALQQQPGYAYAQAGIARVRAAQGRYDEAIAIYQTILDKLPLPQWAMELSEIYTATGKPEQAQAQLDLVRAIQQLNANAAMNVDLEMALFEADHGDPVKGVALARTAYAKRPSIQGADALAWALYHAGEFDEAWMHAQQALKLGTKDALLHFHTGMIAAEVEGHGSEAQRLLRIALDINPHFSVRYAPVAQMTLAKLAAR